MIIVVIDDQDKRLVRGTAACSRVVTCRVNRLVAVPDPVLWTHLAKADRTEGKVSAWQRFTSYF